MIEQPALTGERLAADVVALAGDVASRRTMAASARALARPDAAGVIVERILSLAGAA
jgi:UDP-N-acetylglucosamine:LPS N-acetylglucosamine transferase